MAARKNLAEAPARDTELVITRIFDAPRELVWKAWTDPAHLQQWMGPRDYPAVSYDGDARPGGVWRGCLRPVAGGADLGQGGAYREIIENEKLVFTFAWDEAHPANGHDTLVTVTFADHEGKTKIVFRQEFLPSIDERDGHRGGWNSSFDRLDDHLRITKNPSAKTQWAYPPNDPVILMSRLFDAPRELVWQAFTEARHMAQWWGPHRFTIDVREFDARPGGKWRIAHTTSGGESYEFFGEYLELKAPERLVWTFGFRDYPPATETMTFEDRGDKTLAIGVSRYTSAEGRDGMRASGMEEGAAETYERLDALLKAL